MTDQPIRTLLVEDNPGDVLLIQEALSEITVANFDLVDVDRLDQALDRLQTEDFDVVLLDLQLPDSSGLDTFLNIHTLVPLLPIVVLTGIADETLAIQAMQAGAQDYLVKGQVSGSELLLRSIRYAIERKRITVALQQNERDLRSLTDNAPDIITRFDRDLRHIFINRAIEKATGLPPEIFLGKTNRDLGMPSAQVDQWDAVLLSVFHNGQQELIEFEFSSPNGKRFYQSQYVPEFAADGSVETVLAITRDVTDQKQLEAQFLRAQRLESLGTLASGIAHDMNNILTPILGVSQLLSSSLNPVDDLTQNLLNILEESAKRGATLVKQILSFVRGSEGSFTALQVRHVLTEVVQICRQTFPKTINIILSQSSPEPWLISADTTQIHQVLMNLLVNARDAMPNGGELSISVANCHLDEAYAGLHIDARPGAYVVLTVTDSGVGIAPENLDRMFEPFFTTKEVGKGTGLGLSTVLGVVKSHGGFVHAYSDLGHGSSFQVYLPATVHPSDGPELASPTLQPGHGELILVVDDEAFIRDVATTILESFHYRVMTAIDGVDAIATYSDHHQDIHAIVLDLMMPVMDARSTILALRHINPDVQIITMSGLPANQHNLSDLDIPAFIAKPFSTETFIQTLQNLME
jgi:two-component system, cell cycle sensor histidine kinase and response regulator CckA